MKNYIKKIALSLLVGSTFIGCGNGGGCCLDEDPYTRTVLEGETITVYPGDSLLPTDDLTVIDVTHTYGNNIKEVMIVVGSAKLIRGDYVITN